MERYYLFESKESGFFAVCVDSFPEALDFAINEFGYDVESLGEISEMEVDSLGIDVF